MGTTGTYGWAYPEPTDAPDGATQIKALAQAADATLSSMDTRLSQPVRASLRQLTHTQVTQRNTNTAIEMDTVDFDSHGGWSAGNPTRYTCKVAGIYQFVGGIVYANDGDFSGKRQASWAVNGDTGNLRNPGTTPPSNPGGIAVPTSSFMVSLSIDDYVEMFGFHNAKTSSGADKTMDTDNGVGGSWMTVLKISD